MATAATSVRDGRGCGSGVADSVGVGRGLAIRRTSARGALPPPPPPPPGPGPVRNTRRAGGGTDVEAVSAVPDSDHTAAQRHMAWTAEEAKADRPRRPSGCRGGFRANSMAHLRAWRPARTASAALKSPDPLSERNSPEPIRPCTAAQGTPAARAISSTVNVSENGGIGVAAIKANPLPQARLGFRPEVAQARVWDDSSCHLGRSTAGNPSWSSTFVPSMKR